MTYIKGAKKNPAIFLPLWVYGIEIPIDFLKLLMISGYVSSVPHVLYIAPTFPLPSPVQKIRKLPLGTKNCPLCIPILCSVISLWLCWEMICSSRRPWLIALRHYFLISCKGFFFSRAFRWVNGCHCAHSDGPLFSS